MQLDFSNALLNVQPPGQLCFEESCLFIFFFAGTWPGRQDFSPLLNHNKSAFFITFRRLTKIIFRLLIIAFFTPTEVPDTPCFNVAGQEGGFRWETLFTAFLERI